MTFRELEKRIKADGWYKVHQVGSHCQYKHPTKSGKITIPCHHGDINPQTARRILQQAGIL